jgi:hypothetical protein
MWSTEPPCCQGKMRHHDGRILRRLCCRGSPHCYLYHVQPIVAELATALHLWKGKSTETANTSTWSPDSQPRVRFLPATRDGDEPSNLVNQLGGGHAALCPAQYTEKPAGSAVMPGPGVHAVPPRYQCQAARWGPMPGSTVSPCSGQYTEKPAGSAVMPGPGVHEVPPRYQCQAAGWG